MTFDMILDVAIGLTLVFALFSLLVSILVEIISAMLNRRGRMLELSIYQLLDGERPHRGGWYLVGRRANACLRHGNRYGASYGDKFFKLQTVRATMDGERLPSYLTDEVFASGVIALLQEEFRPSSPVKDYASLVKGHGSHLANLIHELSAGALLDATTLKARLIDYYNSVNNRVSGWYVRETNIWLLFVGFAVAAFFNVNTIVLTHEISANATLRDRLVNMAMNDTEINDLAARAEEFASPQGKSSENSGTDEARNAITERTITVTSVPRKEYDEVVSKVGGLKLPIGQCRGEIASSLAGSGDGTVDFDPMKPITREVLKEISYTNLDHCPPATVGRLGKEFLGWILTALALSLGAPFWFDLLSKLVAIRKSGILGSDSGKKELTPAPLPFVSPAAPERDIDVSSIPRRDEATATGIGFGTTLTVEMNSFEKTLTQDDILDVQRLLGVRPEFRDGTLNRETRDKIRAYRQNVRKQPQVDGFLDESLVLELFERR